MLRARYDEDLFRDSTMTFGEHLEDLRRCLFKAVLGLLVGLIVGFFVGKYVVEFIQTPLTKALEKHVIFGALENFDRETASLVQNGYDPCWTRTQAEMAVKHHLVLPEIVWMRLDESGVKPATATPVGKEIPGLEQPKTDGQDTNSGESSGDEVPSLSAMGLQPVVICHALKDDRRLKPTALNAHEVFMIWLKASLLVGIVLSSPWIFIQLWSFVAAGLYPHEKRYVHMYLPFSISLFLLGVAVAFYVAFPLILKFLFGFNRSLGIEIDPRISEWLSFVMMLPLGFGVAFQLPLVMLFLQRIGIVTVDIYLSYWRVAVLVIFAVAALLTPPDPWSMSLLALPLTLLYFGGILLCKWLPQGPGLLPVD